MTALPGQGSQLLSLMEQMMILAKTVWKKIDPRSVVYRIYAIIVVYFPSLHPSALRNELLVSDQHPSLDYTTGHH